MNIYHIYDEFKVNEIIEILWKIFNYYYQISDSINNNDFVENQCLNIYLLGKFGSGKSSFINELFGEKKALENFGKNVTEKINTYSFIDNLKTLSNKKGRINIFDTPGFSQIGQVLEDIKNKLNNIFDDYISNKDMIHCFLYFLNGSIKRTFDENEIELIKYIHDKQKSYFSFFKNIFYN